MFDRHLTDRFLNALSHTTHGTLSVTTPDGQTRSFGGRIAGAEACLTIHDWRMVGAILRRGDIGLAETYRDGFWDADDLSALFLFGLQNQAVLDRYIYGGVFGRVAARIAYLFSRNTLRGSQKNIHAHYDLGNDFYALWLDPTMTYSAALFSNDNEALDTAQIRKYDRIIDHLHPSGNVLEIGCGWGGFADRALIRGDYAIKGLTLSQAQHDFASQHLGNRAQVAIEDYRVQHGTYDNIVSIEMFEAVGEEYWPVYFAKVKSLLAAKGRAMIQAITIDDAVFDRYRRSGDAIRSFIFPGGMLPSPTRFETAAQQAGLRVTDRFAFGQDYALTLRRWLQNFEAEKTAITAMGFDEAFIRMWRFYLTTCIAGFAHGRTDVVQWELQHAT